MMSRYELFHAHLTNRDTVAPLFQDSFVAPNVLRTDGPNIPVDLHETADAYVITASLAGWKPDEVNVMVQDNTVVLAGEYKEPAELEADKAKTYHVRERPHGSFQRAFTVPTAIDVNQATANFQHGVLTLTLPKAESGKPRKITVRAGDTGQTTGSISQPQAGQPPTSEKPTVASKK
jgi:HSP20 family protein